MNYKVLETFEKDSSLPVSYGAMVLRPRISLIVLFLIFGITPLLVYFLLVGFNIAEFKLVFSLTLFVIFLITLYFVYSKYKRSTILLAEKYLSKSGEIVFWEKVIKIYLISRKSDNARLSDKISFLLITDDGEEVEIETEEMNYSRGKIKELILSFWSRAY